MTDRFKWTTDEVRAEVRRGVHDLTPDGGYVGCSVHNIQREVPPDNINAMFEEALACGSYPIHGEL